MIQVTQSALIHIRTAIDKYKDEVSDPYIRLNMGIG